VERWKKSSTVNFSDNPAVLVFVSILSGNRPTIRLMIEIIYGFRRVPRQQQAATCGAGSLIRSTQ
jgi:hypothetical protein